MRLGIIGPSEDEIMPFIKKIFDVKVKSLAMLNFYEGTYSNINVVALYSGVCKVNASIATQILIDKFDVSHIIVVGVAGGIDRQLRIGDTVIGTQIAYHDVEDGVLTDYHPWMDTSYFQADEYLLDCCRMSLANSDLIQSVYFGKIVTGEAFIAQSGREEIISRYKPLCVDMETAAIAHVCYVNQIPFLAIRSISDTEEESGIETFEENCADVSMHSIEVLSALLEQFAVINEK